MLTIKQTSQFDIVSRFPYAVMFICIQCVKFLKSFRVKHLDELLAQTQEWA